MKIKQTFVKGYETSQWEVCTGPVKGNWKNLTVIHQMTHYSELHRCFLSISKQKVYITHMFHTHVHPDPCYREAMYILSSTVP